MFKFKKKIIKLEPQEEKELEAIELWEVRWNRRYGKYHTDIEPAVEVFTNREDAEIFCDKLKEACKILKCTESINLSMNKKIN